MTMLALSLALGIAASQPVSVLVIVPLCDGAQLACGRGGLGDPGSPEENLYWGALYGAERVLRKERAYVVEQTSAPAPPILRELHLRRRAAAGERELVVTLRAYDGRDIQRALTDCLDAIAARSADLVVWAGHDVLMDIPAPARDRSERAANAAVLACASEEYFGPVLDALGARAVALTRSFMAPEGYLLDALLQNVARHGPEEREHLRAALVGAYAKYQRVSRKAAGTVFSHLE